MVIYCRADKKRDSENGEYVLSYYSRKTHKALANPRVRLCTSYNTAQICPFPKCWAIGL